MPRTETALPRQRVVLLVAVGLLLVGAGCLGTSGRAVEDSEAVAQQVESRHDALSGYSATVVRTVSTGVLASEGAALSSTRKAGDYTVAARAGNVTAVGDTTFLEPGVATTADNERFVTNVARFLVTGEKAEGVPEPAGPSTPPGGGPSVGPPTAPAPPTAPNGTESPNGTAAPATPTPTPEG